MSLFSNVRGISTPLSLAEKINIPLESIISAYTLGPAKKYGLLGRGIVKVGYAADIAVFSSTGAVKELFVNGTGVVHDGVVLPSLRSGKGIIKKII
jgi:adenine deaminase